MSNLEPKFKVGEVVEVIFDYFSYYTFEQHKHKERKYFAKISSCTKTQSNDYYYGLENHRLVFFEVDLKKID